MAEPLDGAVNATRRSASTFLQERVPEAGTQVPDLASGESVHGSATTPAGQPAGPAERPSGPAAGDFAAGEVAATEAAVAGAAANAAPLTVLPSRGHQSAASPAPSTAVSAVVPPAPVLPPGWPAVADLLRRAVESRASDLHLVVGAPPTLRINGRLYPLADLPVLTPPVSEAILRPLAGEERWAEVLERGQKDFSYGVHGLGRFRINVYRQRGVYNAAMRVIPTDVPPWTELGLPAIFPHLADLGQGLILVTGATGSGKSTTLAALVDLINSTRSCHIITLEDPIEYLHHHKLSLVEQREIGGDTLSFADGLRAALREDPDVILVGEMRDLETISTAITAAETGHLVLATMHTNDAVQSVDRVVDVFPPHQQQQIRIQLAATLQAVISQQLLPRADGQGRVLAAEVLVATAAAQNLIREGKTHQLYSVLQAGAQYGMQTFEAVFEDLVARGLVNPRDVPDRLGSLRRPGNASV